jgi:hypothetical protein
MHMVSISQEEKFIKKKSISLFSFSIISLMAGRVFYQLEILHTVI